MLHFYPIQPDLADAVSVQAIQHQPMLANLYVEALLADEELADEVWGLWGKRMIDDELAAIA